MNTKSKVWFGTLLMSAFLMGAAAAVLEMKGCGGWSILLGLGWFIVNIIAISAWIGEL